MKVNIQSTILNKILKISSSFVSSGNINPIYDGILVKANQESNTLSFVTLNDNFKFNYMLDHDLTVISSGVVFLKYRNLEAIISKLQSCEITLEKIDSNSLRITKQNFESNMNIIDESIFIDIDFKINPSWDSFTLNSNLLNLVEKKIFHCCLSKTERVSHLNGVYFDSNTKENSLLISSTDSYRAALLEKEYSGNKFQIILEQDLIKFLNVNSLVNQPIDFYTSNSNLYVKIDNMTLISKINTSTFPKFYSTFETPEKTTDIAINSNALFASIERGNFIVNTSRNPMVWIKTKNPQLEVSFKSPDIGNCLEFLDTEKFEGEDFKIVFNSKLLLPVLKAFEGHSISLHYIDPNRQVIIKDEEDSSYKQIILPIRVS
ncbi:MAG: DNA polymerase III subunit beta [Mycoplasma sp.]